MQKSRHQALFWMAKFKPLFGTYMGPCKDNFRYFCWFPSFSMSHSLPSVFSINVFGDPAINLFAITAMVICICLHRAVMAGVYDHKYLNIIEYSFLVNGFSRHCFCGIYCDKSFTIFFCHQRVLNIEADQRKAVPRRGAPFTRSVE